MISTDIQTAAQKLLQGQLVAIPTETVYGLAACIDQPEALKNIFLTKQRPFFDPLIVHVSDRAQAQSCVSWWPKVAQTLAENFWPGPLTLVLPKSDQISDLITSGLQTVGVRCPRHPMTHKLLELVQKPLAAPSANKFGRTSPTLAAHVQSEFTEDLFILDGGACDVGIESSILQITLNHEKIQLQLLRQGHIDQQQIDQVLLDKNFSYEWSHGGFENSDQLVAPGQMRHHYMPSVPLVIVHPDFDWKKQKQDLQQKLDAVILPEDFAKISQPNTNIQSYTELILSEEPHLAARQLYAYLRSAADKKTDIILFRCQKFHLSSSWQAIWERLSKAATLKWTERRSL
ncbi:MAG: L-threonylcarbamoyladenylate synthase [Pseudobdellovibrionaceae bacterium]